MKQTEHYKLNLIESTDTFSPTPLNENATLLEQALDAASAGTAAEAQSRAAADSAEAQARAAAINSEAQARAAADNALASRVTALEGHKFAAGTYTGKGTKAGDSQTIKLGFTPAAVFVSNARMTSDTFGAMAVTGHPVSSVMEIVSGGFKVYGYSSSVLAGSSGSANNSGVVYHYIALR